MTAGLPLWPISAHVLLTGFCFLRPQWYPKPIEPDSSAERTSLCVMLRRKHARGSGYSTRSTIRKRWCLLTAQSHRVLIWLCHSGVEWSLAVVVFALWKIKHVAQSSPSTLPCVTNKLSLKCLTVSWQSCSRTAPVYRSAIQIIIYGWCFSRLLIADSTQSPSFPPHQLSHAVSAFV